MAKGGMKSLEALQKILANPEDILDLVSISVAEEAMGLIKDGFRTETDPYGRKWAPKQNPDGRKTLSGKTARLKNLWHFAKRDAGEIVIAPGVKYAIYHQNPLPRERMTSEESLRRSLDRGHSRRQLARIRDFDSSFVGPAQLKRPRRMMVPDSSEGMPRKWEQAFNEAATDALAAIFGGDGRRVSALRRRLGIDAVVGFKVA